MRVAPDAYAASNAPSRSRCGSPSMRWRSLKMPGSPSSALTMRYFGALVAEKVSDARVGLEAVRRRGVEEDRDAVGRRVRQDAGVTVGGDYSHDRRGPAESAAAGRHDARAPASPHDFLVKRRDGVGPSNGEAARADTDDQRQPGTGEGLRVM